MNSIRRHHADRMLRKAKLIAKLKGKFGSWLTAASPTSHKETEMKARRIRDHRCSCSCQMCRNPRHSTLTKGKNRRTIQERRALLKFNS